MIRGLKMIGDNIEKSIAKFVEDAKVFIEKLAYISLAILIILIIVLIIYAAIRHHNDPKTQVKKNRKMIQKERKKRR